MTTTVHDGVRTIHLQGIGQHRACRVDEAQVGGHVVYNYGARYKILEVRDRHRGWVVLVVQNPEGKVYHTNKRPGTLIGYIPPKVEEAGGLTPETASA